MPPMSGADWLGIFGVVALLALAGFVFYRLRRNQLAREQTRNDAEIAYLEETVETSIVGQLLILVMFVFNLAALSLVTGVIAPAAFEIEGTLIWIGGNLLLALCIASCRRRRYTVRRRVDQE